jgi:hypothetical protein
VNQAQPFEDHAGIKHDDHGRPAARALRISPLATDVRLARALLNWRNTRLRRIWTSRSRTALRISSAMTELLFAQFEEELKPLLSR